MIIDNPEELEEENDDDVAPAVVTNVERLRAHLKPGTLAVALLNTWVQGQPASRDQMLAVLHAFHEPKAADNAKTAD